MSLDVSRNSLIAVDIRLAMMNLFVASSGCFFGAMGEPSAPPRLAFVPCQVAVLVQWYPTSSVVWSVYLG